MITEWFFSFGVGFFGLMADTFPRYNELDGVIVTAGTALLPIVDTAADLSAWIPWWAVGVAFAIVVPAYVMAFLFRLLRAIAGHIPFIGGNG